MTRPKSRLPILTKAHSRRTTAGVCIFLALIVWLVFAPTLRYEFVNYDDENYVYQNTKITIGLSLAGIAWAFTHVHARNWHPLTTMSHMLDCQLYGLKAGGHHFTNVLLHSIAVILLFLVLRQMTGALWRSAFVAAVFAIHPLRVESVAWVAERKDVLSAVFFMLTLSAYVCYVRKPSLDRYTAVALLFVLGLMSKPMLVTVPLVLLLVDYWPLRRFAESTSVKSRAKRLHWWDRQSISRRLIFEKIPLLALSAVSGVVTFLAQRQALARNEELPLFWRINNALVTCMTYVWQMIWPVKLAVFYPHPHNGLPHWEIILSVALLAAITASALALRKRHPYIVTGWLWYLVMLVPVIGLIQVGWQGHADRYTYLPQIGLYLLVSWAIAEVAASLRIRRQVLAIVAVVVIAALSSRAWIQTSYWRDSETLWRHALAVTSNNDVAQDNLGIALFGRGQMKEAVAHWRKSLELHPDNANIINNLGMASAEEGRISEAIALWEKALALQRDNASAQSNLAWVLATSAEPAIRDGAKAVQLAEQALQLSGGENPVIFRTLAAAYAESGRFSEAIEAAQRGRELATAQGNSALANGLERNIALYRANSPLRDIHQTETKLSW
jgi:tetratricopeptide (TPR) repeat protein